MIRIYCRAADALLKETQTLTSGMLNYPEVLLTFSNDWDGFGKAAVVRAGETTVDVVIQNGKFIVPAECLAEAGVNLIIGVSGSDGLHTIPTVWCSAGEILEGTDINEADNVGTATPSLVDQMLAYAAQIESYAEDLDTSVIRSVVADNTNVGNYGVPNVSILDSGSGNSRTLTFVFSNLAGKGIKSVLFTTTGENRGMIQVKMDDDTIINYSGIKDALDALDSFEAAIALAETARETAEQLRAAAESERASAETARASAETGRATAETARASAETARATAETSRATAESSRASAETTRNSAETSRISAETARASSESSRQASETERIQNETERQSSETLRISEETSRATAESGRAAEEARRVTAENARASAETSRASSESTRSSNETTRQTNEANRVSAETARQSEWTEWGDIVVDAEAYARGTRNGTNVASTDPAYHNNSKYYAETATTAKNAADAAKTAAITAQGRAETAQLAAETAAETFDTDPTLAVLGKAADAEAVGIEINNVKNTKVDGGFVENGALYLTANGEIVAGPFEGMGGGGGGGGSGNNAVISIQNTTGWLTKTISEGSECEVSFTWSSTEDNIQTGNGTVQVYANNSLKLTRDAEQGSVEVEVGGYLNAGNNAIKIIVTDVYGNSRTLNYTIRVIAVSISSSFDAGVPQTSSIMFSYTPVGNVSKTVYFVLDGTTIDTRTVTASGRQQSYIIPAQSHGRHTLRVYFECDIDGETIRSNELYYELICLEDGVSTPIVVSNYHASTAEQYVAQSIAYRVYTPSYLESQVTLWANGVQVGSTLTIDRTEQIWEYRPDDVGSLTLEIKSGTATRTFNLNITESTIHVNPVTEDLALYLNSFGRSNSDSNRASWVYGNISAVFSGFNWTSDGWQFDTEGNTTLRLSGDARLTIPYQIFAQDFRGTGKTIEIDFSTRNILNYDATILSCMSDNRGISLTAQKALFASEQSSISTQYKEDEHVRLSFVVEKRSENRLLSCYINGVLSGVVQYPTDDDFSQSTPVGISVGSNYCGIDLYCIRVYDNSLTREQILSNWIADTQTITAKLSRYNRNNVLNEYGQIVIEKLPTDLPYLVLTAPELPQYKGDKKTVSGYYVNPADPTKDFTFVNAQADVQGTSSQYYARKNYKIKFREGFIKGRNTSANYQMRSDSVPTNTFTFKADVASSEGANNVELARLYNDSCPYQTPPQQDNSSVRQGIDGFPIVMFWDDGRSMTFIGKYNFNNDKGTEEVFGFDTGDESWETLNNTSDRVVWKDDDFSGVAWQNDFEGRYPDGNTDPTNLAALASWIKSTDQSAATGDALSQSEVLPHRDYDSEGNLVETDVTYTNDTAAYRLDKFRKELEDHFVVDSALFYYLFTELFLMVDSRAKNAFPTMYHGDDGLWCFLPYDFDTALGINNEGSLAFGYELEDIDTTSGGANVYNGQNSVLWINIRQGFFEELKTMYRSLRSAGVISYSNVENMFETHQGKWPEAIFNEDSYFKYIEPLINDGDGSYLEMCLGSKAEQRKWWLYNRFRYIDSKYNAGDALTDYIDMRSYARSNVTIVPYADIYPTMKFGSYFVSARGHRNTSTVLNCPGTFTPNDTETQIYCASQLASVGDLSGLKLGRCDFHMATRLQSLKIGDRSSSYSNGNLTSLTLGNNVLLQTLDVRNCPNLAQAVDISGCTGIEEVYFDGTAITGLSLPNGGQLRVLHLPSTITNLTIRNHGAISDFTMPSYSNITTLRLENVNSIVPSLTILNALPANSRVRLIGVYWTFQNASDALDVYDTLDTMRGLDENGNNLDNAVISGTISIPNITGAELAEMQTRQPNVNVVYEHVTCNLYYYNYDGSTLLYTESILDGGNGSYSSTPSRTSTAQYTYAFAGWSLSQNATTADSGATKNVTADRSVYAAYTATIRTYTVRFMNGTTVLQTYTDVPYGSSRSYTGETPVHPTEPSENVFIGFNPTGQNITGNTDCLAQWRNTSSKTRKFISRTITTAADNQLTSIGSGAFYGCSDLTTVDFPAVTSIDNNAFSSCSDLTTIDLPAATSIGNGAFYNCTALTTLILRNTSKVATLSNTNAFSGANSAIIYVPDALVDSYKAASNWSNFASRIKGLSELPA